jgi:hypothetical protein
MGLPPVFVGAFHHTIDEPRETTVARTSVGALGTEPGVAAADCADATPVPASLVAVTVNVYRTPFVRPSTAQDNVDVEQTLPPGLEVTV